jgi:hypothetical protein
MWTKAMTMKQRAEDIVSKMTALDIAQAELGAAEHGGKKPCRRSVQADPPRNLIIFT